MNKTKKLLIDITFTRLYKYGYCATALKDILEDAQLTKGAIYYNFKSKNDLVLETMQHYIEQILESHWIEPFNQSEKPRETLLTQIDSYLKMFEDKDAFLEIKHGCPLSNFILDMSDKEDMFFEYLQSVYKRWQNSIEKALTKAQTLKQTTTQFDAEQEALFIISSLEGCIGSAKAYNDIETLRKSFNSLCRYIKNL